MRKILTLTLSLVVLSLLTVQVQAVATPVVVKRVKDVCFIFAKGDHQTKEFSVHYDNLSSGSQMLHAEFRPQGGLWFTIDATIIEGGSMEAVSTGNYGMTMYFKIVVNGDTIWEDTIMIPPLH